MKKSDYTSTKIQIDGLNQKLLWCLRKNRTNLRSLINAQDTMEQINAQDNTMIY